MTISTIEIPDAPAVEAVHDNVRKHINTSWLRWFQSVKKANPLFPVDTTRGNQTITLPIGADYLNREHLYLKSSADANTVTINGAAVGGAVVLSAQGQKARFRYDGKNWWAV